MSSERLAELAGVNAAKVRKDLSYLGSYGTRGVGYDVDYLVFQMSRELGLTQAWPVVIVGAGNLGPGARALRGLHERGLPLVALVDSDPAKVGVTIGGLVVDTSRPPSPRRRSRPHDRCYRRPRRPRQDVADRLVDAGVRSILNFAPVVLMVPDEVSVRKVDLAVELQILSFYQQRRSIAPPPPRRDEPHTAATA